MKIVIHFMVLLCIILAMSGSANAADTACDVEIYVLSAATTASDRLVLHSSMAGIFGDDAEKSTPAFTDLTEIKLGEHVIEPGANGKLLWNGQPKRPSNSPFQVIGNPGAVAAEGQKCSLIQAEPVEYFEKSGNAYLLKTAPPDASPSISMDFIIESKGDEQVKVDFHLTLSVMTGRKKLASTALDADEPILKKKDISLKLDVQLGKWLIPSLFVAQEDRAGNKEYLIVLMIIRRLK